MKSLLCSTPPGHPARPAGSWPEWTDRDCWELGPPPPGDEDDEASSGHPAIHDDPTDEELDRMADEAEAQDRLECGHLL